MAKVIGTEHGRTEGVTAYLVAGLCAKIVGNNDIANIFSYEEGFVKLFKKYIYVPEHIYYSGKKFVHVVTGRITFYTLEE